MRHQTLLTMLAAVAFGCGGTESGESAGAGANQPAMQAAPQAADAMSAPTGEIDAALASQGEGLFTTKGCAGCHMVTDQRLIGPGLRGVTERRAFDWVVAMIANPDSMLVNDAAAQSLYAEYNTPMVNMGVSPAEARAIYEHLRSHARH